MRQRVGAMRVDAELGHHRVRAERAEERRHDLLERRLVDRRVGERLQRQVHGVAGAGARACFLHEAGAGEQVVAALVGRDRQHVRVAVERVLHAVAVMRVDVDIKDAHASRAQAQDRQHRVVHVAEARRACGHRVVQAAREVERAVGAAVGHQVGGQQRAGGAEASGVPEAGEHGVVAGAEAEARRQLRCPAAVAGLQHLEIFGVVVDRELRLGGGLGRAHDRVRQRREPVGLHEPPCEPEPLHAQRMLRPVVEPRPRVGMDQRGFYCNGCHEAGLDRGWPERDASRLRSRASCPRGATRLRPARTTVGAISRICRRIFRAAGSWRSSRRARRPSPCRRRSAPRRRRR